MGKFNENGKPNGQTEIFSKEALKQEMGIELEKANAKKSSYAWGILRPAIIFLISLAFVMIVF